MKLQMCVALALHFSLRDDEVQNVLCTLHYPGEASDLLWCHGKTYSDWIEVPIVRSVHYPMHRYSRFSRPKYEWWMQLHNAAGKVGWIKPAHNFSGGDAYE